MADLPDVFVGAQHVAAHNDERAVINSLRNSLDNFRFPQATADEWMIENPVLLSGQPGYEQDTGKLKIGNGISSWAVLGYLTGAGGSALPNAPGVQSFSYDPTTAIITNPERGFLYYTETHYKGSTAGGDVVTVSRNDDFTGTNGSIPSSVNTEPANTPGSSVTIQNNAARFTTGATGSYNDSARLVTTLPQATADVTVSADITPTNLDEAYFGIVLRGASPGQGIGQSGYKFEVSSFGSAAIQRIAGYSGTPVGTSVSIPGFAAGVTVHVEASILGTTLTMRAWTGSTRPTTPTIQATDATYNAGYVGLILNAGSAAKSVTWTVDNWNATGTTTSAASGATGHVPLVASALATERSKGQSYLFRYYYIERYLNTDTIEQAYLDLLQADFNVARTAGMKMIIRFAYSDLYVDTYPYGDPDPTKNRVLAHISQLSSVINNNADVISVIEAGFIGIYGEWYYTKNFTSGTNPAAALSSQNIADRNAVLNALLNLDSRINILVRYVGTKATLFNSLTRPSDSALAARWDRVGFHNDALNADSTDYGTYGTFPYSAWTNSLVQSKAFLASETERVLYGGEIASNNVTYEALRAGFVTNHATFFNPSDFAGSMTTQGWTQANKEELARLLGYRLRLSTAQLPTSVVHGTDFTFKVTLVNEGFAAPIRNYLIYVDLVPSGGGGTVTTKALIAQSKRWVSGQAIILSTTVTAPEVPGNYSVYLRIVDPTPSLSTNPLYSIQLANPLIWDAATGRNSLTADITVS